MPSFYEWYRVLQRLCFYMSLSLQAKVEEVFVILFLKGGSPPYVRLIDFGDIKMSCMEAMGAPTLEGVLESACVFLNLLWLFRA